jgi:hypothetical protein
VFLTQRTASVDQQPQHRELMVIHDRTQSGHPAPAQRYRVRVSGVGLTTMAVTNTLARADSFGGTSTTSSPIASSRTAS